MSRPSRQLQAEWNAKLKASGFVDIERADGQLRECGPRLNDLHTPKAYTFGTFDIHRRYYEVATQILESGDQSGVTPQTLLASVPKVTHIIIRRLHAEGVSNREMERQLGVSRYLIGRIVRAFAQQIKEQILNGQET